MGYSHQGCATSIGIVFLKGAGLEVAGVYYIIRTIGVIGFVFIVIFNVMASFALLQVLLKALSQKIEASNYSFDSYGMFWGTSAILCPTLMVLLYQDIRVVCCTTDVNVQKSAGNVKYMLPFVFAFPMIVCAPVAIYFGFNFNLPTPSVYFLPAKLLCCCSEKRARALVLFTDLLVCLGCRQFLCFSWSVCCVCLFSSTICCYCECYAACVEFDVSHLHHGIGLHSLCICWFPKMSQEQC